MLTIDYDFTEFSEALRQFPDRVNRGLEAGLTLAARETLIRKNIEIRQTYDRVIPTLEEYARKRPRLGTYTPRSGNTGSEPAWERKAERGGWSGSQTIESRRGGRDILTTGLAANYEERLATLPTGPDGVDRANDAAQRTQDNFDQWGIPLIEQEIANAIA